MVIYVQIRCYIAVHSGEEKQHSCPVGTVFQAACEVPEFFRIIVPPDVMSTSCLDHLYLFLQSGLSRKGREQQDGVIRHYYAVLLEA